MKWSIIDKKLRYTGFLTLSEFRLQHDLFAGGSSPVMTRELVERGHAVTVLPYDPVRDEVVLIEQFRIGAIDDGSGPWMFEVVAGLQEPGESPEEVVYREAEEEAGCTLTALVPMLRYYSTPGSSNEQIHAYLGRTSTAGIEGIHGVEEEGEDIRVHVVDSRTAFDWLDSGKIDSAMPVIALQWFHRNRERIREEWLGNRDQVPGTRD